MECDPCCPKWNYKKRCDIWIDSRIGMYLINTILSIFILILHNSIVFYKFHSLPKKRKLYTTSDYSVFISFIERRLNLEPFYFCGTPSYHNIIIIDRNWINFYILYKTGLHKCKWQTEFFFWEYQFVSICTCRKLELALKKLFIPPSRFHSYVWNTYTELTKILCDSVNRIYILLLLDRSVWFDE